MTTDIQTWLAAARGGECVSLFDVLEHFTEADARAVLDRLERLYRVVVVFTPRGFMRQDAHTDPELTNDPLMWHRSGFTEAAFVARHYTVGYWPVFHFRPHGRYGAVLAIRSDQPELVRRTVWATYRSLAPNLYRRARWLARLALR